MAAQDARDSIYGPLQEDQIRLMRLEHTTSSGDLISCELEVFALSDQLIYIALSYCWTESPPSRKIAVNGRQFSVRPNLHNYLKIMQDEGHNCWIFIDALCINQADIDERARQVKLMGQVYRRAEKVVAWVGTSFVPSKVHDVDDLDDPDERKHMYSKIQAVLDKYNGNELFMHLGALTDLHFKHCLTVVIWQLLANEYWHRMWIVQEILMARTLALRSSDISIGAEQLEALLQKWSPKLQGVGIRPLTDISYFMPDQRNANQFWTSTTSRETFRVMHNSLLARRLMQVRREKNDSVHNQRSPKICDLMLICSHQRCFDTRDKVFGLLGLISTQIEPSYHMTRLELFIRIYAEVLLEETRPFEVNAMTDEKAEVYKHLNLLEWCAMLLFYLQLSPYNLVVAASVKSLLAGLINRCGFRFLKSSEGMNIVCDYYMRVHVLSTVPLGDSRTGFTVNVFVRKIAKTLLPKLQALGLHLCRWHKGLMSSPGSPGDARTIVDWSEWTATMFTEIWRTGATIPEREAS